MQLGGEEDLVSPKETETKKNKVQEPTSTAMPTATTSMNENKVEEVKPESKATEEKKPEEHSRHTIYTYTYVCISLPFGLHD